MNISYGNGETEFGPGVVIELSGCDVATAIDAWLVSQGVRILGPRTIRVNGQLCEDGSVYDDPAGFVVHHNKNFSGRGPGFS